MGPLTRTAVDAEHYVARFVLGQLSEDERVAFEEFCLLNPEIAEQVETDRLLIRGWRAIESPTEHRSKRSWIRYSMAAGVAFIVCAVIFGTFLSAERTPDNVVSDTSSRSSSQPDPDPRDLPFSERIPLAAARLVHLRGSPQEIEIAADVTLLRLEIDVTEIGVSPPWKISLQEQTDAGWRDRNIDRDLETSEVREVLLFVTLQPPESPRMRIKIENPTGAIDQFDFRVTRN